MQVFTPKTTTLIEFASAVLLDTEYEMILEPNTRLLSTVTAQCFIDMLYNLVLFLIFILLLNF